MSNKLETNEVNKTMVFYSPIEGKDILVRTGVLSNNSFLHSVYYSHNIDYSEKSVEDREKLVEELIKQLNIINEKKILKSLLKSKKFKDLMKEEIYRYFSDIYRYIEKKELSDYTKKIKDFEKNFDTYSVIFSLLQEKKLKKLCKGDSEPNEVVRECGHMLKNELSKIKKSVDKSRREHCLRYFVQLLENIYEESKKTSKVNIMSNQDPISTKVCTDLIDILSEYIDKNIYFIDSETRLPYIVGSENSIKRKRKSILVIHLGDQNYEVVGRLLPGNIIQRTFDDNDKLIRKIYTFILRPEDIKKEYPSLLPYLDNKLDNNFDKSSFESCSERGSSSESRSQSDNSSRSESRSRSKKSSSQKSHSKKSHSKKSHSKKSDSKKSHSKKSHSKKSHSKKSHSESSSSSKSQSNRRTKK
jgi:hypothetical protein